MSANSDFVVERGVRRIVGVSCTNHRGKETDNHVDSYT